MADAHVVDGKTVVARITFGALKTTRKAIETIMDLEGHDQTDVLNRALVLYAEALRQSRDGTLLMIDDRTGEARELMMIVQGYGAGGDPTGEPAHASTLAGKITFNLKQKGKDALELAQEIEGLNQSDTINRATYFYGLVLEEGEQGWSLAVRHLRRPFGVLGRLREPTEVITRFLIL